MHHMKGRSLVRKDQARRLRYQEEQRIKQKCNMFVNAKKFFGHIELSEGQLKSFSSKLIK